MLRICSNFIKTKEYQTDKYVSLSNDTFVEFTEGLTGRLVVNLATLEVEYTGGTFKNVNGKTITYDKSELIESDKKAGYYGGLHKNVVMYGGSTPNESVYVTLDYGTIGNKRYWQFNISTGLKTGEVYVGKATLDENGELALTDIKSEVPNVQIIG